MQAGGHRFDPVHLHQLTCKNENIRVILLKVSGGDTEGETPVPVPNTEVKPFRADDTMAVRLWESRSLPDFYLKKSKLIY